MSWLYNQVTALPIMKFFVIIFAVLGLVSCSKEPPKETNSLSKTKDIFWGYVGESSPEHWGKDYPQCELGGDQSPINIDPKSVKVTSLPALRFTFSREPTDIEDNGHTVEVVFSDDPSENQGKSITLDYNEKGQLANSRAVEIEYNAKQDTLVVDDKEYRLAQFHFHSPSENVVNSQHYPMELHLVYEGAATQFAVVAVFLNIGAENPIIRTLWEHMPTYRGQKNDIRSLNSDFSGLLPTKRGYYTFQGSFTTPPCTRNVIWYVFHEPISVSQWQVDDFKKVMNHNNRPLQPLNSRPILSSQ
ncbi:carbonic anhydrase [Shewanella surugensis]|uniref:Carbonic anhydrase n=1 Tax=Shewanella surugensis TaxID=212020 RepID=A0ABT0L8M2_9GAMM|nr:carbonic anhydrase family protein [Shewanella surugensis]MCL1124051.1 carbonic anhydrase family protein [Shewanella surugensis]